MKALGERESREKRVERMQEERKKSRLKEMAIRQLEEFGAKKKRERQNEILVHKADRKQTPRI